MEGYDTMKKRLQLVFSLYSPFMIWEFILVIQIIIYLFCSSTLISNVVEQQHFYRSFKQHFSDEDYYFQPYERFVEILQDHDLDLDIKTEFLKKRDNVIYDVFPNAQIGNVCYSLCLTDNDETASLYVYNDVLGRYVDINMSDLQSEQDDSFLPALVRGALARSYRVGDRITIEIDDEVHQLQVVVAGYIDDETQLIVPSYGASEPNINSFFNADQFSNNELENKNAIVLVYEKMEPWMESIMNPAAFIIDRRNSTEKDKIISIDGSAGGNFYKMNDLIDNTIKANAFQNRKSISREIAACLFTAVSLFSYTFLLFIRNQRNLGIFAILGQSKRNMFFTIVLAIAICMMVAIIQYFIIYLILTRIGLLSSEMISLSVITYSILLVVGSLSFGIALCYVLIHRLQPVDYLKRG